MTSSIFWHFVRRFVPWLVAIAAYLVVATAIVRWDVQRCGEVGGDFGADLYGMYMQLFFEPTSALPKAPIARLVFWVTPLLGVLLLARGVVRVGASVFDVEERRRLWVKIMSDRMNGHIIVCGLGHVGIRVVESLKKLGADVIAIDRRASESFAPVAERLGVPVQFGDVRHDDVLIEAGIERARAVVCATDDDLANLEVSIDAKRFNPGIRVIMRVFDQRVAGKLGAALDLDQTFSTSALAGPLIALQAISDGVVGVYRPSSSEVRVDMELTAPPSWIGKTVAACEDAIDGRIVSVSKKEGPTRRATHDAIVALGDVLTLDLPASNIAKLTGDGARARPE